MSHFAPQVITPASEGVRESLSGWTRWEPAILFYNTPSVLSPPGVQRGSSVPTDVTGASVSPTTQAARFARERGPMKSLRSFLTRCPLSHGNPRENRHSASRFPLTHSFQDPLCRLVVQWGRFSSAFTPPAVQEPPTEALLRMSLCYPFSQIFSLAVKFRMDRIFLSLYKHHYWLPFLLRESPSPGHGLSCQPFPRFPGISHFIRLCWASVWTCICRLEFAVLVGVKATGSHHVGESLGHHFLESSFSAPILLSSPEAPAA